VQIGDKIPEFSLLDQNGVKRSNKGLKNPLVLFFYPKDDTPGCTIEVCGFRDKYDLFKVLGAQVWGVSNGSTSSHLAFANKNKLQYPLLCDKNDSLRKTFKVPWILAGGISAEIIPEIFSKLRPDGIDASSRLEISPGIKDIKKVESLVREIREQN